MHIRACMRRVLSASLAICLPLPQHYYSKIHHHQVVEESGLLGPKFQARATALFNKVGASAGGVTPVSAE